MKTIAIFSGRGVGDFFTLINFLYSLQKDNFKNKIYIFLDDTSIFEELLNLFNFKNIILVKLTKKNFPISLLKFRIFKFDYLVARYLSTSKLLLFMMMLKGKKLVNNNSFFSKYCDYIVPIDEDKKIEENEKLYLNYMKIEYKKINLKKENKRKRKIVKIGIHAGARNNDKSRIWTITNWINLIKIITKKRQDVEFYFFGGKEDENLYNELLDKFNNFKHINYVAKLSIKDTFNKIGGMNLFISTNSGLMHMAAYYKLPQIALCGPSRREWYPYNDNAVAITSHDEYFYLKGEKEIKKNRKYFAENITVNQVIKAIENIDKIIYE